MLLQRSIASLVAEWNTDLQEFVAQQKKSEKTKADVKSDVKTTANLKQGTSARGSIDTVRKTWQMREREREREKAQKLYLVSSTRCPISVVGDVSVVMSMGERPGGADAPWNHSGKFSAFFSSKSLSKALKSLSRQPRVSGHLRVCLGPLSLSGA